jgi:hypothetical protein
MAISPRSRSLNRVTPEHPLQLHKVADDSTWAMIGRRNGRCSRARGDSALGQVPLSLIFARPRQDTTCPAGVPARDAARPDFSQDQR